MAFGYAATKLGPFLLFNGGIFLLIISDWLELMLADLNRQLLQTLADAGTQDAAKNNARSIAL
jgi:hypothetical protein